MLRDYTPKTAGLGFLVSVMACGGDAEQRTAVPLDSNLVCYEELSPNFREFSHPYQLMESKGGKIVVTANEIPDQILPYQLMESKGGKIVVTANEIPDQIFHSDSVRLTFASQETDDTLPEGVVCYDGEGYPHWPPLKRVKSWEYYGLVAYDSSEERSHNGP